MSSASAAWQHFNFHEKHAPTDKLHRRRRAASSDSPDGAYTYSTIRTRAAVVAPQQRRPYVSSSRLSISSSPLKATSDGERDDNKDLNHLRSKRGLAAVDLLPSYLADARAVPKYCKEQEPTGALQLGVAESQLMADWLMEALKSPELCVSGERTNLSENCIYYQPTAGRQDIRQAFASYMQDRFLLPSSSVSVNPDNIIVGAGCNAVLENLCFTLASAGEAVLIPTPYYAAFEFDLVARAGLHIQPVKTATSEDVSAASSASSKLDPSVYYPTAATLDVAYERAAKAGHTPRILLLSHPQNPLGVCYPPETVKECIDWCRSRKVHLVSDEIYGASVYQPEKAQFVSALQLASSSSSSTNVSDGGGDSSNLGLGLGPYVHWVYALSKDFALSGLRVGAAYTENEDILLPMQKLNDLCQISSTTQIWTAGLLNFKEEQQDEQDSTKDGQLWIDRFQAENHRRLNGRSAALLATLEECGIPYLEPTAGLFVWMDFSEFLPQESTGTAEERESELYKKLVHDFGLLFTPGMSMKSHRPGLFRFVFTAATSEEFELSLERVKHACQALRQSS